MQISVAWEVIIFPIFLVLDSLVLVRLDYDMIRVWGDTSTNEFPQPAGTGGGTVCQLRIPLLLSIYIQVEVTVVIRINSFRGRGINTVVSVFLVEINTIKEF